MGYSIKDARNYVLVGCWEQFVPYKTHYIGATNVNVAKILELALNNGKDRLTGEQIGPKTGDPRNFKSIQDVIEAFKQQLEYFQRHIVEAENIICYALAERTPLVFQSAFIDGCIESGVDATRGGALYNAMWEPGGAIPNVRARRYVRLYY